MGFSALNSTWLHSLAFWFHALKTGSNPSLAKRRGVFVVTQHVFVKKRSNVFALTTTIETSVLCSLTLLRVLNLYTSNSRSMCCIQVVPATDLVSTLDEANASTVLLQKFEKPPHWAATLHQQCSYASGSFCFARVIL